VQNDINNIRKCLQGDKNAFENLVKRYQPQITAMMWRFTRNKNECERLVQDVFVEAYFSLENYKAKGPFLSWLKTIATRTGYKFWKNQMKHQNLLHLTDYDHEDLANIDNLQPSQAAQILTELLERLSPPDRLVLTLMYFQECTTQQIAQQTRWSKAAVKMRAMRARNKLKKLLQNQGF
jgi:RNA polymerase sigma-70 factor, ECF subfamily